MGAHLQVLEDNGFGPLPVGAEPRRRTAAVHSVAGTRGPPPGTASWADELVDGRFEPRRWGSRAANSSGYRPPWKPSNRERAARSGRRLVPMAVRAVPRAGPLGAEHCRAPRHVPETSPSSSRSFYRRRHDGWSRLGGDRGVVGERVVGHGMGSPGRLYRACLQSRNV